MDDKKDLLTELLQANRGLFKNVPRFLKTAVAARVRELEQDPARFDREAVANRAALRRLCALLHVPTGERAQATLFHTPPHDSPLASLSQLKAATPARAAALVREHRLPFLLVESVRGALEPELALALAETISDDELLDRLRLFAKRAVLKDHVRRVVLTRLRAMKAAPPAGLTYRKVESIARLAGLDAELASALFALVRTPDARPLLGATALLVDVSASMDRPGASRDLASEVAVRIDRALPPGEALSVVAFGADAVLLEDARGRDVAAWRAALTVDVGSLGVGTSAGAALNALPVDGMYARVVVVTGGYENRAPRLAHALAARTARTGLRPGVCLVQPADGARQLAVDLRNAMQPFEVFTADPFGAGLDALVPTLAGTSAEDVFATIAGYPLPTELRGE